MISLYFHIPFCTRKCPYCHFYVVPNRAPFHRLLEEGLALEWDQKFPLIEGKEIASIYFGGGTPTLFAPDGIGSLLSRIRKSGLLLAPDCEITIEANPEESSQSLFEALRGVGVNRLSLGVQSLDERSLQTLERTHSAKKAEEAIYAAERAGLRNISIDLMYDLPEQTESSWSYTLERLSALPIQHLSLYNLTIEPHTSFYKRKNSLLLPDSETSLRFLGAAVKAMEKMGLFRYEISAFSLPGYESRHNLGYWTGRPFLGYGPSAFSFWEGERFQNIARLQRYAIRLRQGESPIDFREHLPYPANRKELFAVALRLIGGAVWDSSLPKETEKIVSRLIEQNYLAEKGGRIRLTEKGLLFYDTVASEII